MSVILGIDPGTRIVGYGILETNQDKLCRVEYGVLTAPSKLSFFERIYFLGEQLQELLQRSQAQDMAMESIFMGKNADSAFKLGHFRGICVFQARCAQMQVYEYATRLVKKSVTGSGAAEKEQVRIVMQRLLGVQDDMPLDASDALALAYHHWRESELQKKLASLRPKVSSAQMGEIP